MIPQVFFIDKIIGPMCKQGCAGTATLAIGGRCEHDTPQTTPITVRKCNTVVAKTLYFKVLNCDYYASNSFQFSVSGR